MSYKDNATLIPQYGIGKILLIWALAALPMGILSWIVFPAVSPAFHSDPLGAGVTRLSLLAVGGKSQYKLHRLKK